MHIETPIIEQHTGFAFNSNDFAMTFPSSGTLLPSSETATIENWDDDEDENTIVEVEIDPDLEDEDSPTDKGKDDEPSEDVSDDDDEFEQYLFGEDED